MSPSNKPEIYPYNYKSNKHLKTILKHSPNNFTRFRQEKTAFHYLKTGWLKDIARDPLFLQREVRAILRELMTLWIRTENGKIVTPLAEILKRHVAIPKEELLNPEVELPLLEYSYSTLSYPLSKTTGLLQIICDRCMDQLVYRD